MSSLAWMSKTQSSFLKDHVQKLQDARTNGTAAAFYDKFYTDWFTKFPELGLVFPNAKTIDNLSKDDKEKLKWHGKNKKVVCFDVDALNFVLISSQKLRWVLVCIYWSESV